VTTTLPATQATTGAADHPADPTSARVEDLLARMTPTEKLAQLVGFWVDEGGAVVAPMQDEMADHDDGFESFSADGLGHITRAFGTKPVDPTERASWLHAQQHRLRHETRLGIGAIAHEECLNGFTAWQATMFPAPPSWGASFDPELVERMGAAIGASMRSVGVHQGLAPVLDVVRDPRWGRVEECIAEDPYLVGTLGTHYVRGLQSAGVHATLKHFVGYSASRSGRNLAPVHAGPREVADVLLPPFEMAVRDGGVRSVMAAYNEIDGVPAAADPRLLTDVLRDGWGFDGTVVADYFGVAFLQTMHDVATDLGDAAHQALVAGLDVELPTGDAFLDTLAARLRDGRTPVEVVDRAVRRVLRQKAELGLLPDDPEPTAPSGPVDLDPPEHRALAARLAEESVVLVTNDGTLPLPRSARVAVVGPNADAARALFGCYTFVNHVLDHFPDLPFGIEAPTVRAALAAELGADRVAHARGCAVDDDDVSGIAEAVDVARSAEVAVVVVGDKAGLFGRGTSGEGCDRDDLELPGVQRRLVEDVVATGTPVVLVVLSGRPYAIGWATERCAAVVQTFFPGQEGGRAVARVLSGAVNPSGRLPMTLPRSAGAQPYSYLHPRLGAPSKVSTIATEPPATFGHGLSYTTFEHHGLVADATVAAGGAFEATVTVRNTGDRAGADVVQLYARDVVGSVTRPTAQLLGYARVQLAAGEQVRVRFTVPTARLAFSDRDLVRVVEPGDVELWVGPDCRTRETAASLLVTGDVHRVTGDDGRWVDVDVERSGSAGA